MRKLLATAGGSLSISSDAETVRLVGPDAEIDARAFDRLADSSNHQTRCSRGEQIVGIDTLFSKPRPGMSEIELAAEIEYAMRSTGSDYPAVPTWMASGPRNHCQHAMASPYRFRQGDLIHAEFAGGARRYHVVTMGPLVLGEPDVRMAEVAEAAKAAYAAGLSAAHLSGRIGNMEAEYRAALADLGAADCCPMRFGTGLSATYPPVCENQITIQFECDDVLEEGMAYDIHAPMQSLEDKHAMLMGGSYLMRSDGPLRLDKSPIDLVRC